VIKIFTLVRSNYKNFELFFNNKDLLKINGVEFVSCIEESDVVFVSLNMGDNCFIEKYKHYFDKEKPFCDVKECELLASLLKNKKVIAYYRADGPTANLTSFFDKFQEDIKSKKLIFLTDFNFNFKKISFEALKFIHENPAEKWIGNHVHISYNIYKNYEAELSSRKIKVFGLNNKYKEFYDALKLFTFIPAYTFLNQNYDVNNDINNKPIDVFFVKTYRFTNKLPSIDCFMRQKIKDKLQDIKSFNVFTDALEPHEYLNILAKSKICISCGGLGESDWETKIIMNNCIHLKLDVSYIKNYYDYYDAATERITYFKYDLSDLEEKIRYILDNYSTYKQKAIKTKEHLLSFTSAQHIEDFCNIIKNSIE